ncbi:MAG TPA: hypothetical protein VE996_15270 [Terriglobales bacterium]|nr:hypothetical protein [Terriglobales bacterium]
MGDEKKKPVPKCAHPACDCPPAKGSRYCSDYCKDARGSLELNCNCRHPDCGTLVAGAR